MGVRGLGGRSGAAFAALQDAEREGDAGRLGGARASSGIRASAHPAGGH